jgi:integrase
MGNPHLLRTAVPRTYHGVSALLADLGSCLEPRTAVPKRVPPLSAKALAAVKASTTTIELVDGYVPGLRVRVLPNGTRSWSLNIRDAKGERRRFEVGSGLGMAEARKKAEDLRRAVRAGADPTAERRGVRRRARAARDNVGTLRGLLEHYFFKGPGAQQRRATAAKQLISTVFAKILGTPLLDLDRTTIQLIADDWRSASTASSAIRSLRPCLKWAERRGFTRSGLADLEQITTTGRRDRVVSPAEIADIWPHLRAAHGNVIKWLLLTGCRLNEAAGMTWGEIECDRWTIPAARAKNKLERTIPLSTTAIGLLNDQCRRSPNELVFPSERSKVLSNWDRETKRLYRLSNTSGWHRHDLRRTVATILGDLGFPPHVISVVLGHAHIASGATAVYARSRYQREHGEALNALGREIERIVIGGTSVVQLPVEP